MELEKFILFFFFGFVFGLITDEIIDRRNTESRIRVYIAGPIASDPDYEDNFTNAHIELLMQGYIVENPVEEGKKLENPTYEEYMESGMKQLKKVRHDLYAEELETKPRSEQRTGICNGKE